MTTLRAEQLSANYAGQPTPALKDVSLDVAEGERLLLLGPNGAGKSTFIRVFAGLMRPSEGKALISGQPACNARARVGVVAHATFLYDELTAAENLRLYAELYGVSNHVAHARLLLERVGLAHLADVHVGRMSRGQQQRVAIGRALIHDPEVLLLDEPDTGLDLDGFARLVELVAADYRTVVLTTHHLASGLRLGTRAAVLAKGRIVDELPRLSVVDLETVSERLERVSLV